MSLVSEGCGDVAAVDRGRVGGGLERHRMVLKGVRHVLGRHLARRRGGPGLKNTLIQCTWAAARKNGSYLQAQFQRLRSRPATKRTIGARADSILTAAYHVLKHGTLYHDLGPNTSTAGPRPFRPGA